MQISNEISQQIVEEIGKLVKQNINMMDEKGIIIASTDLSRIGQFHNGAYRIIKDELEELYISEDEESEQVKCGLNLSLNSNNKIVGVIGITGKYNNVYNYGRLIKKMTEILIYENSLKNQERIDKHIKNSFYKEWIFNEIDTDKALLYETGLSMGVNIRKPRRVLVLTVQKFSQYLNNASGQKKIEDVEKLLSGYISHNSNSIFFRDTARYIVILESQTYEDTMYVVDRIQNLIKKQYDMSLYVGISDVMDEAHDAYLQANKAWKYAVEKQQPVVWYDSLYVELLLDDVKENKKIEFLKKVFKGCSQHEIVAWIDFADIYFKCNGSVLVMSDRLYIHKNTVQYRINKLTRITGFDIRNNSDACIFYLAISIYKQLKNNY